MRVVVGGSRFQENYEFVARVLNVIHARTPIARLAHGDCRGTDKLCDRWAQDHGVECVRYPADWDAFGKSAGPRRNADMLRKEMPDKVIAFPGGSGTSDLMRKAQEFNPPIPIVRVGMSKR